MTRKHFPLLILALLTVVRVMFSDLSEKRGGDGFTLPLVKKINASITQRTRKVLPSVHADLLLGMTIGVNEIKNDKIFYDNLVQVGLIHVVVVSGYNVALVIKFINGIFFDRLRSRNKLILFVGVVLYALLCGMQPPVIRAALMGYISYLAMTEGRRIDCLSLILVVCFVMLLIYPKYIVSLSFWLSVGATLGLIFFEPGVSRLVNALFRGNKIKKMLPFEDVCTSLACQIAVWPIISYFFGRVSLISPLYNMFSLWLIPLCTVSGFIFILISQLLPVLAPLVGMVVFPFFDMFVRIVQFFAAIDRGSVDFKLNLAAFIMYYLVLGGVAWRIRKVTPA